MSAEINTNERRVDRNGSLAFLNRRNASAVWATYNVLHDGTSARYADRDAAEMYRRECIVPGSPEDKAQQEWDRMMAHFAKYGCE